MPTGISSPGIADRANNVGPDEQNTAEERGSGNERSMIRTCKRPHHVGQPDEPDKPDDAAESDSYPHYERNGYQEDLFEALHAYAQVLR